MLILGRLGRLCPGEVSLSGLQPSLSPHCDGEAFRGGPGARMCRGSFPADFFVPVAAGRPPRVTLRYGTYPT